MRPPLVGAGRCHVGITVGGGGAGSQTKVQVEGGRAGAKAEEPSTLLERVIAAKAELRGRS